jgi:bis(5'-nucleosidyl)-tetraphosphatase
MKHADRWDLPKGRVDPGESDLECALREFEEETGIPRSAIELDPGFRFELVYYPIRKKTGKPDRKTLVMFLATVADRVPIDATEHLDHEWIAWRPPHDIQGRTIDPLLDAVAAHLDSARG